MAEELADIHAAEGAVDTGVVSGAEIPETPEKPLSIRESLTASIKEVGDKEQRARDIASGKFIPKDKSAAPEKVEAVKPNAGEKPAIQSEKTETASKPSGPPPGWSAESKAFFNSLPADHPLRQDVEKRELEVSNGFKKYSDIDKRHQEIEQAIAPFRSVYQQNGLKSDAEAISRLLEWESSIRGNPAEGIRQLAQKFGVNLSQFAQLPPQGATGQEFPEHLQPVLNEFGQLKQTVNSMVSAQQQAEQRRVASELETFAKDKPHFESVRVAMGQLMQAGMAKDISDAYDQAVWANPELREQLLREQDEKRQAEFLKTQTEAANKARLAAVSPAPRARQGAPMANGADKGAKGVRASLMASIGELRENNRA